MQRPILSNGKHIPNLINVSAILRDLERIGNGKRPTYRFQYLLILPRLKVSQIGPTTCFDQVDCFPGSSSSRISNLFRDPKDAIAVQTQIKRNIDTDFHPNLLVGTSAFRHEEASSVC